MNERTDLLIRLYLIEKYGRIKYFIFKLLFEDVIKYIIRLRNKIADIEDELMEVCIHRQSLKSEAIIGRNRVKYNIEKTIMYGDLNTDKTFNGFEKILGENNEDDKSKK